MRLLKNFHYFTLLIITGLFAPTAAAAQCAAANPEKLLDSIKESFTQGDTEKFACLYIPVNGKDFVKDSVKNKYERRFDAAKVLTTDGKKANLFIGGIEKLGNSGDETFLARNFSGLYEAEFSGDGWKVTRALPYRKNIINSHSLDVEIFPAQKLHVRDEISINVTQNFGFAVNLNHRARILKAQLNGKNIDYLFGGGLFWANVPPGRKANLLIEYDIEVEANKDDANSGFWGEEFGHVRNQYYWHPFYDFSSETDQATFKITARIPKEFEIVTSVPQTSVTNDRYRVVTAAGEGKTEALTLHYDRGWQASEKDFGSLRFDIFATPDFTPSLSEVYDEFRKVYQLLETKFGKPASAYFSVVQDRSRKGGWLYHSNNAITTGITGGKMIRKENVPRALFPHEIAHAWTIPTGNASNFLREGWASFAESYFLREEYGANTEDEYFAKYRELYEKGNFEGNTSLLTDFNNRGISYYKGAWVFRMLRDFIGEENFMRGMRKYILQTSRGKSDMNSFIATFSSVSKKNVAGFLKPWLEEKFTPKVSAKLSSGKIKITQEGKIFLLPLEIELETSNGKKHKTFFISRQIERFDLSEFGKVENFRIDPENKILLRKDAEIP